MKYLAVLGAGINDNQELIETAVLRYEKALEIEKEYDKIICCSGKNWRKEDQDIISEGEAGKKFLLRKGISESRIIVEDNSRDTLSDAFFLKKNVIDPLQIKEFDLITSSFHMPKTMFVFDLVFGDQTKINFISAKDPDTKDIAWKLKSEEIVLQFYKDHLQKIYHIKRGDLESVEHYLKNYSYPFCKSNDKYHEELTKKVQKEIENERRKHN